MSLEQCCGPKRSIQNWDFVSNGEAFVNRMCVNCERHWYGPEFDVLEYDKNAWDIFSSVAP